MCLIPDKSIDMILCDLPYGTTACKWDVIIPMEDYIEVQVGKKVKQLTQNEFYIHCLFEKGLKGVEHIKKVWDNNHKKGLWHHYKRVIKDRGAIVLTASQPFTTKLINSNLDWFKYELIWDKTFGRQPQLANIQPMKRHENVLVFGKGKVTYNPQKVALEKPYKSAGAGNNAGTMNGHKLRLKKVAKTYTHKTPDTVLVFKSVPNGKNIHSTQKPVALFEYLIKTYTNEGETVLDNCMSSGTTAIACINTNRNYMGFEKDPTYFDIANKRIEEHTI